MVEKKTDKFDILTEFYKFCITVSYLMFIKGSMVLKEINSNFFNIHSNHNEEKRIAIG